MPFGRGGKEVPLGCPMAPTQRQHLPMAWCCSAIAAPPKSHVRDPSRDPNLRVVLAGGALVVCLTDSRGCSCVVALSASTLQVLWHRRLEADRDGTK